MNNTNTPHVARLYDGRTGKRRGRRTAVGLLSLVRRVSLVAAAAPANADQGAVLWGRRHHPRNPGAGETLYGTSGPDVIRGQGEMDTILGFDGGVTIRRARRRRHGLWHGGDYNIARNVGNDRLYGSDGNDQLEGFEGSDSIDGGGGDDRVEGGDGNDFSRSWGVTDQLNGGADDDLVRGSGSVDVLAGGIGNDRLYGYSGDDRLSDLAGRDRLDGGVGNDTLSAADSAPTGFNADTLLGGVFGLDTCRFDDYDFVSSCEA